MIGLFAAYAYRLALEGSSGASRVDDRRDDLPEPTPV